MTDDQMNDLKDLITTTVRQTVNHEMGEAEERIKGELGGRIDGLGSDLRSEISELRQELRSEISELRQEMHDGFASIADTADSANDQLDDHEQRIGKLEQQAT